MGYGLLHELGGDRLNLQVTTMDRSQPAGRFRLAVLFCSIFGSTTIVFAAPKAHSKKGTSPRIDQFPAGYLPESRASREAEKSVISLGCTGSRGEVRC